MTYIWSKLYLIWSLLFGWMPPELAALCTLFIGLAAIFVLLKLIAFIWDLLPLV